MMPTTAFLLEDGGVQASGTFGADEIDEVYILIAIRDGLRRLAGR